METGNVDTYGIPHDLYMSCFITVEYKVKLCLSVSFGCVSISLPNNHRPVEEKSDVPPPHEDESGS